MCLCIEKTDEAVNMGAGSTACVRSSGSSNHIHEPDAVCLESSNQIHEPDAHLHELYS